MPRDARVAGHFGEFIQGRLGPSGPVALITLPCPLAYARARQVGCGAFSVTGAPLARSGWARFARSRGRPLRGRYIVHTSLPFGAGAGMSTASLLAVARAAGHPPDPAREARACLAAEGASDPLMWAVPQARLWASRAAGTQATFPPLPRMQIVGGLWGPCQRTDPSDAGFADVSDLVPLWRAATEARDVQQLAALASDSAARNCALRGPMQDPTPDIAKATGALGWATSHTGPARALILPPGQSPRRAKSALHEAGYKHILTFQVGR